MGSAIAQLIADCGFDVTIFSRRDQAGLQKVQKNLATAIAKGTLTEERAKLLLSHLTCTSSLPIAVEKADLVIEAVIEDLDVKTDIFRKLDECCPDHTILSSNTSSLSITSLAHATKRTEKVLGMHFFNPPSVMKLLEVPYTPLTSQDTIDTIITFSEKLGKSAIVVQDYPGFVVNRILIPMINSAAFVLMSKVATAETIDNAMKWGANHPMGPLSLADLIGIDTCVKILHELDSRLDGSNFPICPLLEEMVTAGNLGRKTGQGFFTYDSESKRNTVKKLEVQVNG